jgi:hypothetical protein
VQQNVFAGNHYCFGKTYATFKERTSQYDDIIDKYSLKYGISSALIKSIITAESCFNAGAVSPKGAQGLMQLMPATARRFDVVDSFNTDENIRGGTRYLNFLLKYFKNDLLDTIAAYNAGEGAVRKYKGIPPYNETRQYVSKVSTLYRFYSKGAGEKAYNDLFSGNISRTFFVPRAIHKSRLSPYKHQRRNVARGNCRNRASRRLRRFTWSGVSKGIWQRLYQVKKGDTLLKIMQKTGVHKNKLIQMNGLKSQVRLKPGKMLLVWECRN